jgi:hypothetical protein
LLTPHASGVEAELGSNYLLEESECSVAFSGSFIAEPLSSYLFLVTNVLTLNFPISQQQVKHFYADHYLQQWRTGTTLLAPVPPKTFLLARIKRAGKKPVGVNTTVNFNVGGGIG